MSLHESGWDHRRDTTKGSLMADQDNEKDGPEEKPASKEESRTGEKQAAINRENDPPA
jgi:hypothetical protein